MVGQGCFLQFLGNFQQGAILQTQGLQDLIGCLLDNGGTRVEVLVHAMAEAHEAKRVVFVFGFIDPFLGVATVGLNGLQHLNHLLIGTAVQRTPQGVDAG